MKSFIAILTVAALFVIGAMAYAHGTGAGGWGGYGGHMMEPGYGGHIMGGYGGHMMDRQGPGYGADKEFLDKTADLRKELHEKKFDYFEATRNPETEPAALTKLEKELYDIQSKIRDKAPRGNYGGSGHCW